MSMPLNHSSVLAYIYIGLALSISYSPLAFSNADLLLFLTAVTLLHLHPEFPENFRTLRDAFCYVM